MTAARRPQSEKPATLELAESGERIRGRPMAAEEYLAHVAYAFAAAPQNSPEETVAKALLELAAERLGVDPQEAVGTVLKDESGGRVLPPWHPELLARAAG